MGEAREPAHALPELPRAGALGQRVLHSNRWRRARTARAPYVMQAASLRSGVRGGCGHDRGRPSARRAARPGPNSPGARWTRGLIRTPSTPTTDGRASSMPSFSATSPGPQRGPRTRGTASQAPREPSAPFRPSRGPPSASAGHPRPSPPPCAVPPGRVRRPRPPPRRRARRPSVRATSTPLERSRPSLSALSPEEPAHARRPLPALPRPRPRAAREPELLATVSTSASDRVDG